MSSEPKKDPNKGCWTPEYVAWAVENMSDEEIENTYKKSRAEVARIAGIEAPADEATPADEAGQESQDEAPADEDEEDLENMHHKTFQKKYGMTKDEYRANKEVGQP